MLAGKSLDVQVHLPSDREIEFCCRFKRKASVLFDAWTKPEHLQHWWGCEGSSITECAIDLRVGGSWNLTMRMADGSDHPFHGRYQQVARPSRVVYTECYEMPQFGNPEWLTTVRFEETEAGTTVTHTLLHTSREMRDGHLQAGMQEGSVHTLRRLDDYAASMEAET